MDYHDVFHAICDNDSKIYIQNKQNASALRDFPKTPTGAPPLELAVYERSHTPSKALLFT